MLRIVLPLVNANAQILPDQVQALFPKVFYNPLAASPCYSKFSRNKIQSTILLSLRLYSQYWIVLLLWKPILGHP